jgi:PPP family 3-phenylpropionic acid transporter
MHAATFGSFHASAVAVTQRYFRGRHHSKGQAIYTSVSYGLGGTAGGLLSGWMWDGAGPAAVFSLCSAGAFVAFMLMWKWVKLQPEHA